jgi:hypothetical protein
MIFRNLSQFSLAPRRRTDYFSGPTPRRFQCLAQGVVLFLAIGSQPMHPESVTVSRNVSPAFVVTPLSASPLQPQRQEPRMSHFSRIVRGGVVMGLLTMASGSVLLSAAGQVFDPGLQVATGVLGCLMGGYFGAREAA